MERTSVEEYLVKARTRLEHLYRATPLTPQAREQLLTESMEQLADTLEELQVAAEELRERNRLLALAHHHYRELYDSAPDGYIVTDRNGVLQEANRAAARMLGAAANRLRGKPLVVFVAKPDRRAFRARIAQLGVGDEIQEWELTLQPRGGPDLPAAVTVTAVRDSSSEPVLLRWLIRDITERKRTQECLREMAREILLVQEEERQHVSRVLYGEVGQALAAINMRLQSLPGEPPTRGPLGAISSQLGATLSVLESMAHDLRPPALDMLGLNTTLREYCRDWGMRTEHGVDYRGSEVRELPDTLSILLYRLMQETLSNVAQHAHAQHIRVSLKQAAGVVRLSVEDDGRGFDPQTVGSRVPCGDETAEEESASRTLFRLRERIELLGGHLEIASESGRGTRVEAQLPSVL